MSTFLTPLTFDSAARTALVQLTPQVIPETTTLYTLGFTALALSFAKTAEGLNARAITAKLKTRVLTVILLEIFQFTNCNEFLINMGTS
jgi:hypothetical protein